MQVVGDLSRLKKRRRPVALAIGFFDGVHLGHREVIRLAIQRARRLRAEAWVLTFAAHPLKVLHPERAPLLLTSNRHKLQLLKTIGPDGCILMPFTRALAGLAPARFAELLRASIPGLREVFVGRNWRFGHGRRGTPAALTEWGRRLGFRVNIARPVIRGAGPVSSSRIRARVLAGDLAGARTLLGRSFGVLGAVVRGRAVGRTLGFPTANLNPHNEVLPPQGVYAVCVRLRPGRPGDIPRRGVLNFGLRPTFLRLRAPQPVVELHLLDWRRRIYGRDIEVIFVKKIRDERRFSTVQSLSRRIAKDVAEARRILRRGAKSQRSPYRERMSR
ncbi:MAG: riboflavin biosynthesis protein RibF [Verrucomicrobiota bacterium]|nr:riboflavin biosynthesis protein RibF [Verrucomicrobiota bacterium]